MSEIPGEGTSVQTRNTQAIEHVFAMRKSGHHAIAAWLQACYEEAGKSVLFANSVYNEHLHQEGRQPDPTPQSLWEDAAPFNVMIANYQEIAYSARGSIPAYNFLQSGFTGLRTRDTVVVRDFYSMAASRLHYIDERRTQGINSGMTALDWSAVGRCWIDLATTVLGADADNPLLVGVAYNKWFTDSEYRRELAAKYNLPNSEKTLDDVPSLSGGSSFDGLNRHGSARAMNVLRRWDDLSTQLLPEYLGVIAIQRGEIDDLNSQLFGFGYAEVVEALS